MQTPFKVSKYKDLLITLQSPEDSDIFRLECLIDKSEICFTFCFQIYKLFFFRIELIDTETETTIEQCIDELKQCEQKLQWRMNND